MTGVGPDPEREISDDEPAILAEINITPLTDVFLVLLIIFMVGAAVSVDAQREGATGEPNAPAPEERGLQVRTPTGSGDEMIVRKDVVVAVMPDGGVYVDGEVVSEAELPARLREAAKGSATARVVVRGDENASYRTIMRVISTARSSGLTDVALSTRTGE